jgi:ubiquinone/menaquinone biosynthesis C-methylase UbiE
MLDRRLEPEVMDTPAEARDYNSMEHAAVNRAFVDDFLAVWDAANPVLDLGTGTALIPIELCRRSAAACVVGVDLAAEMLKVGAANVAAAGLASAVELRQADAKALPFPDGSFAAVMSNSIVHHIPDPRAVLAEAVRVTRPGGLLFVRDLMRPPDRATIGRLVETYAGDATEHQRQMFADSLHAALTLAEVRGFVAGLGFDPAQVRATSDRHWTWTAANRAARREPAGPDDADRF